MTISDMIAQLKRHMDKVGATAQVKVSTGYGCTDEFFDAFQIRQPVETPNEVWIIPDDVWLRRRRDNSGLKELAAREAQR